MSTDETIETLPPAALREAVAALWRIRVPGPENFLKLFKAPEFVRLLDICLQLYPGAYSDESRAMMDFALSHALDALGLPGRPPPASRHLALHAGIAAARLHAAFERRQGRRVYLCPLDKAGDLPQLRFGPNRIVRLTAAELEELVDLPRLKRINPTWTFDAKRFSEFTWLVIEETYPLAGTAGERAEPGMFEPPWSGAIEPHQRRFPAAVEKALFAMLLAPWEDCIVFSPWTWRCFEVPWVYETNNDLFIRPPPPPSPASLSWTEPAFHDEEGEVPGTEEPERRDLKTSGIELSDWLNDSRWVDATRALKSPLFETPIAHFFVKASLEDPLDEFVAHLITLEAALGLESDPHNNTTARVVRRISKLLGTQREGEVYRELFKLRSRFLHGRQVEAIPADKRVAARRLARKVAQRLVEAAVKCPYPDSREYFLKGLEW